MLRFLLVFLLAFVGCKKFEIADSVQTDSIKSTPSVIDFGKKRSLDTPVLVEFTVENLKDTPICITSVTSGCGCTVFQLPDAPILPHQKVTIPVKIDLIGRFGDFVNKIQIDLDGETSPVFLDIKGRIVRDVWFNGQAVRCTADSETGIARTSFDIHTIDHPEIQFNLAETSSDILLREVSRSLSDGETTITFFLEYRMKTKEIFETNEIILKPVDSSIAPISIPFHCFYEKQIK